MTTYEVINYLIENRNYKSYLEIGLDNPEHNFLHVNCPVKESVDPYFDVEISDEVKKCLTYRLTSDEMFENMDPEKKYDIVFVDGGHTEEQCCRDIVNSMKHLNKDGCILVHDCIPYNELTQRPIRETGIWNGDVWKSIHKLNGRNIKFRTVTAPWGMAVIEHADNPYFDGYCGVSELDYDRDYSLEKLNVISEEDFVELYRKQEMVKKGIPINLVAHFYVMEDFGNELPYIYKVHFECIKKYASVFTNSTFVLAVDDGCPKSIIDTYKKEIANLGIDGDLVIKVRKNSAYREGKTFKEEVVDKMEELDGITYFVHGKGVTNFNKAFIKPDSILEWVIASYYQLFNDFDDVVKTLISENIGICYGPFLFVNDFCLTRNKWYYSGALQCINTKKLANYISNNGIKAPLLCDRAYAETFLGDIITYSPFVVRSYQNKYGTSAPFIMYENAEDASSYVLGDEYSEYLEFKKEILSKIDGHNI